MWDHRTNRYNKKDKLVLTKSNRVAHSPLGFVCSCCLDPSRHWDTDTGSQCSDPSAQGSLDPANWCNHRRCCWVPRFQSNSHAHCLCIGADSRWYSLYLQYSAPCNPQFQPDYKHYWHCKFDFDSNNPPASHTWFAQDCSSHYRTSIRIGSLHSD